MGRKGGRPRRYFDRGAFEPQNTFGPFRYPYGMPPIVVPHFHQAFRSGLGFIRVPAPNAKHAVQPPPSMDNTRVPILPGYSGMGMPDQQAALGYPNPYTAVGMMQPPHMINPHYMPMQLWGNAGRQSKAQQLQINNYPIHPDVKFKRLPFYDLIGEVIKPSTLLGFSGGDGKVQDFKFNLSPQQIEKYINESDVSLQLRFCLLETSCDQDDVFPPCLMVKINGKFCQLPMPIPTNKILVEPKRPPGPVNITSLAKMTPVHCNIISVSWKNDFGRQYVCCLSLVKKLTSSQLLMRLKNKGTKHSDFTRSLIKEKLREDLDCEIATTSLRVSLVCPLGKMRMICPCRPSTCSHLQCFDASLFLQMNERKSTWVCPVCDKPALYDNLVVDGYFQDVLNSPRLPGDCVEIQLHKDGSWSVHLKEALVETMVNDTSTSNANIEIINDDVDVIPVSDGSESGSGVSRKKRTASAAFAPTHTDDVVDLVSDDSDDDDLPLKRRAPNPEPIEVSCDPAFVSADSTTMPDYNNEFAEVYINESIDNNRSRSTSVIMLDSPSPPGTISSPPPETVDSSSKSPPSQSPEAVDSPPPPPECVLEVAPKSALSPGPADDTSLVSEVPFTEALPCLTEPPIDAGPPIPSPDVSQDKREEDLFTPSPVATDVAQEGFGDFLAGNSSLESFVQSDD